MGTPRVCTVSQVLWHCDTACRALALGAVAHRGGHIGIAEVSTEPPTQEPGCAAPEQGQGTPGVTQTGATSCHRTPMPQAALASLALAWEAKTWSLWMLPRRCPSAMGHPPGLSFLALWPPTFLQVSLKPLVCLDQWDLHPYRPPQCLLQHRLQRLRPSRVI